MSKYTAVLSKRGAMTIAACPETGSVVGDLDPDKALEKLKHATTEYLVNSIHAYAGIVPDLEDMDVIDHTGSS